MNISLRLRRIALTALALAVTAGLAYWAGGRHQPTHPGIAPAPPATVQNEPKVLYWYDPMYPDKRFDKPGKSPFMDMQLVPKYAGENDEGTADSVNISPRLAQNLGVRFGEVRQGSLANSIETAGSLQADESRQVSVQSRTAGWVERLAVRSLNERVSRGQLLARIYSPELLAAQEEFLLIARTAASDVALLAAARQRLTLLGMNESQIAQLASDGQAQRSIAIHAPANGVVSELGAREGAQVSPGMTLFSLVDLSSLWVIAEVAERDIGTLGVNADVEATLSAFPGEVFTGKVDYVYPGVNAETRTVRVRSRLQNQHWKLKPGMVASVRLHSAQAAATLLAPSDALIRTGTRTVAIVVQEDGRFKPVAVQVGRESQGQSEILGGLQAGQRVVISGQFLLDSEANLQAGLSRLDEATPALHFAEGVVESIETKEGEIVIEHGPFETLKMPAMTMGFAVKEPRMLQQVKPGEHVRFGLQKNAAGQFVIAEIKPVAKP